MKLLLLSDLHLEHAPFQPPAAGYDAVILAGDIRSPGRDALRWIRTAFPRPTPVIFVPGNHEFYDTSLDAEPALMREEARQAGVHFLDRDEAVIDGVRFLGCTLWTDFLLRISTTTEGEPRSDQAAGMGLCAKVLADYRAIQVTQDGPPRRLTPPDTLIRHEEDRRWLANALHEPFEGPTVVITHHAPHRLSLAAKFAHDRVSTGFVNELPPAFFEVPRLWVHGHTHTSFDYRVGGCRVVCNPRGYPMRRGGMENEEFDPACVVEVG